MKPDVFSGLSKLNANNLDEACKNLGLDFPVKGLPLRYEFNGEDRVSPRNVQITAMDTGDALGVVGLVYTIVPYREAFAPVDELIRGGARIIGGGAPNFRERAYLRMEQAGTIKLSEGDEIVNQFLITSSHDGSSKIEIRMTPYRKRNGTALTFDATRPLAFKHTPGVANRINRARKIYSRVNNAWEEFSAGVAKMVCVSLTDDEARSLIDNVFGESDSKRMENIKGDVYATFKTGAACQLPKCKGTLFGLVQAFAEWADHGQTVRKSSKRDVISAKLDAKLVSDSAKKKQKAWATALWFAKNRKLDSGFLGGEDA